MNRFYVEQTITTIAIIITPIIITVDTAITPCRPSAPHCTIGPARAISRVLTASNGGPVARLVAAGDALTRCRRQSPHRRR
jgi:hypothetical protein